MATIGVPMASASQEPVEQSRIVMLADAIESYDYPMKGESLERQSTPMSEVSTAPSTPFCNFQDAPAVLLPHCFEESEEEATEEYRRKVPSSMPPLKSELAKQAQAEVLCEQFGRPLSSDLGKYAQAIVEAQECNEKEAIPDGPAITPDGQVVDLDGGLPIFFSHGKELASSQEYKCIAKEDTKALRALQVAQAACEAEAALEAEEVCSIDESGVIRGAELLTTDDDYEHLVKIQRLKLFHRRKQLSGHHMDKDVVCIDAKGTVFLFMYFKIGSEQFERIRRRQATQSRIQHAKEDEEVMAIDSYGVLQSVGDGDDSLHFTQEMV